MRQERTAIDEVVPLPGRVQTGKHSTSKIGVTLERARVFFAEIHAVLDSGWRRLVAVGALMLTATGLDVLGVALIAPFLAITIQREGAAPAMPTWLTLLVGKSVVGFGLVVLAVFVAKGCAAYRVQRSITRATERERARLMTRLLARSEERRVGKECRL